MTDAREKRALDLLAAVLYLDAPAIGPFLERECAGDAALRARVESLLAVDALDRTPLDRSPEALLELLEDSTPVATRVGPWRLVRELGRGGMGVVWLAERDDAEFERLAALKLIRPGPDDEALAARFLRERQILADLRHPAIAQLYDGGRTDEGRPYLVMEYVEGRPTDAWCRERNLPIEERLRLFRDVCDAVQHAHQNLIVHRDLKPAHVLVTDAGQIKLLDFGIARLLDAEAHAGDTVPAFTPRYASPEQLRRAPATTATDVYALGVMLYELLAGRSPFEDAGEGWDRAKAVLETDPPAASTVAVDPADRRALRGDPDRILKTALRRDAAARYATAAALRDDIDRHLRHEPIAARPEGGLYRTAKFVRRHRVPVAFAILAVAVAILAGFAYTTRIARERTRVELEARKAGEVRDFLVGLFNGNLPTESLGDTLTVRDLLERGVARADSLRDQPDLRALLLVTLGDVYRVLGRYDRAETLLNEAAASYDTLPPANPLDRAGAYVSLAMLAYDLGNHADALEPTRAALEIQRRALGEDHPEVLSSLNNLATVTANTGDIEGAIELHAQVLAKRRRLLGEDDPFVAVTLNNIGTLNYRLGNYEQADAALSEALALRRRVLPPTHPDLLLSMANRASVLQELGRLDEAEALMREALDLRIRVLGEDHPRVAVSHYNLGRLLQTREKYDEAEAHLRAALDSDRATYGAQHREVGVDAYQLGVLLTAADRCETALDAFAEAVRVFRANGEATEGRLARARLAEGDCLRSLGREAEARSAWSEVVAMSLDGDDAKTAAEARERLTDAS